MDPDKGGDVSLECSGSGGVQSKGQLSGQGGGVVDNHFNVDIGGGECLVSRVFDDDGGVVGGLNGGCVSDA